MELGWTKSYNFVDWKILLTWCFDTKRDLFRIKKALQPGACTLACVPRWKILFIGGKRKLEQNFIINRVLGGFSRVGFSQLRRT